MTLKTILKMLLGALIHETRESLCQMDVHAWGDPYPNGLRYCQRCGACKWPTPPWT